MTKNVVISETMSLRTEWLSLSEGLFITFYVSVVTATQITSAKRITLPFSASYVCILMRT